MDYELTLAEVARRTGLTTKTLRSYERSGLLAGSGAGNGAGSGSGNGAKTGAKNGGAKNGARRYSEHDVARIRLLDRLRATGMSISQLREYTELTGTGKDAERRRHEVLVTHREQVLARIARLHEDLALIEYQIQQTHGANGVPGTPRGPSAPRP